MTETPDFAVAIEKIQRFSHRDEDNARVKIFIQQMKDGEPTASISGSVVVAATGGTSLQELERAALDRLSVLLTALAALSGTELQQLVSAQREADRYV